MIKFYKLYLKAQIEMSMNRNREIQENKYFLELMDYVLKK